MTDPTFDLRLDRELAAYAQGGVRPIDPQAMARELVAATPRPTVRRLALPVSSTALRWLAIAAMLGAALAAALIFGTGHQNPLIVDLSPTPSSEPVHSDRPSSNEAVAIVFRQEDPGPALDAIAVHVDGREQQLGRIEGRWITWGLVSDDGWAAVVPDGGATHVGFVDLQHRPGWVPPTVEINGGFSPMRWGPNGLLAAVAPSTSTQISELEVFVVDVTTGQRWNMGTGALIGSGPAPEWAPDGSGLVVVTPSGPEIRHLDGTTAPLPPADRLGYCRDVPAECNGTHPNGFVWVEDAAGARTTWYDGQLAPARLQDAQLAKDRSGVWLALERVNGSEHDLDLVQVDEPGHPKVVTTFRMDGTPDGYFLTGPVGTGFLLQALYDSSGDNGHDSLQFIDTAGRSMALTNVAIARLLLADTVDRWAGVTEQPTPSTAPEPTEEPTGPRTYVDELIAASPLLAPMRDPLLVPLLDDRVLIFNDGKAEVYRPADGSQQPLDSFVASDFLAATRAADGRVLVIGLKPGVGNASEGVVTQVFDPLTDTFTAAGPMVTPRQDELMVPLQDGRILIGAGVKSIDGDDMPLTTFEAFDPATSTFSSVAIQTSLTAIGSMAVLGDGRVLMVGDTGPQPNHTTAPKGPRAAEVYDPVAGTVTATGAPIHGVRLVPTTGPGVFGFWNDGQQAGRDAWDPETGTFRALTSLPAELFNLVLLDDGRLLGTNGYDTGLIDGDGALTKLPARTAWSPQIAVLEDGRVFIAGGTVDGVYTPRPDGLGYTSPDPVDTVTIFR